jgi:succinate dehydrogenase/fumarate reductase flavoprotein subunit
MLVAGGMLSADTLILRDGSRINGTMLSADERTVSFVDARGDRRSYNVTNVEEIEFGAPGSSTTRSRTETSATTPQGWENFTRLHDDLSRVMERSNLSARQREMLEEARTVLSNTGNDLRDNRQVERRDVRLALNNIRYVMNATTINTQDRRLILDNIDRIRDQYPEFGTSGSQQGTRTRDR